MATTKAFELAQLSALTTVGADTSLADSLNLSAATHSFQISGTPVLSYSGGNVIVGDLGAGVGLEFSGSTHLITDTQGVNVTGELDVSGILDVADTTTSTSTTTGALVVAGGVGIAENLNVGGNADITGNLNITGDLTVEGTQVTLNTTALDVEDKNITLNYHATNDTSASADGAGITIQDAVSQGNDATILWGATHDEFSISHPIIVSDAIYSNGSSPRVQLQDTDGTNQFSFFQQSTSQLSLRLRNDASDGSFLVAGYGGSTTTNRFLIGSTGDVSFYEDNGTNVRMAWDASAEALILGSLNSLRPGSVSGMNNAQFAIESVSYNPASIIDNQDNATSPGMLVLGSSRGTNNVATAGGVDILQESDVVGSLRFSAADGTDLRSNVAEITAVVTPGTTPAENAVSGDLIFGTTNQGQNTTARMRITNEGKVGIGTTWDIPIGTLDTNGNITLTTTGTGSRFVGFYQNVVDAASNDLKAFIEKNGNNFTISNIDDGVITIANNDGDGANRERLQIRNEGFIFENNNIGAKGQTTPQFDVHLGQAVSISSGRYLNWDTPLTEITVANHAITVSMDDDSATSQPKTIGLTLHNESQTNNTFAPAITWGSQSNSGTFSQATAGIAGRRTSQGVDANWHGGELHFYTAPSGTLNGLGLKSRMSIADLGAVYMTNGELYLGTADSSSAHINSYELMTFNIDVDNDDTDTRYFAWYKNGASASGTELMRLKENATIINNNDQPDIRPALNFDFVNSKELDPRFTFYRSTKASYVGEDGFVKFANQNVPRFDHNPATGESLGLLIEENRTNEIIDSVNMYSSWSEDYCAIQRNYALAPDGTWSAIRIQPDGTDNASHAQQTLTVSYSTAYSISAFVKSDGADYAFLTFANTGFNGRATIIVNLSNGNVEFESGTTESSITSYVEEYKNGWWRIGLTVTSDSANGAAGSFEIGPSSESTPAAGANANPKAGTDNTKALLVWGPQREVGTNISSYIPSRVNFESRTSAASYINEDGYIEMSPAYEERFTHGYDGTKLIKAGPIIEPTRTNLHENSEWNLPSNPTILGSIVASGRSKTDYQAENTTAPDGSLWPIMITNAVTGGNYYYQNYSNLTLGTNYTFSIFFRLPNSNTESINSFTVYAHNNSFPTYYYATYDFTTDAITQSTAGSFYTIQKYPNNWRRISLTAAPDANSGFDFLFHFNQSGSTTAQSYSGGGTAGLKIGYVFGPQLEEGNQPTTYIPTGRRNTNTTVARAADTATFYDGYRLDDLCDIYDTDEINSERGSVYTEWSSRVPTTDGVGGVFEMWDSNAGGTNGIDQRLNSFYVTNNYGISTGSYLGPGVVHKTSLGYDRDNILDWKTTLNGVHTATNSVHKFSMNLTRLSLGRIDLNPAYMLNGHLKRFVLYNSQLSLEEQKVMTEND